MASFTCALVRDGRVFSVEIADGASVGALKKAIAGAQQFACRAHEMKLFDAYVDEQTPMINAIHVLVDLPQLHATISMVPRRLSLRKL